MIWTRFSVWCFCVLMFLSPPAARAKWQERMGDRVPVSQRETLDEGRLRYAQIAHDFVAVVFSPDFVPLFPGKHGRARTVALGVAVAHTESGMRKDVDLGLGPDGMGDNGRSFCLFQIQTGKGNGTVPAGPPDSEMRTWTGRQLVEKRQRCIRAGLEMIRMSLATCSRPTADGTPLLKDKRDWLSAYTTGTCRDNEPESRRKLSLADRVLRLFPLPPERGPEAPAPSLPSPPAPAPSLPPEPSSPASSTLHAAP